MAAAPNVFPCSWNLTEGCWRLEMRKLAGVGYDHSEGAGRLAWILQTTDSKSGGCRTRTLSSYWSVCVTDYRRRDGWYLFFFLVCLLVWELTKPFLPRVWKRDEENPERQGRKEGEERKI